MYQNQAHRAPTAAELTALAAEAALPAYNGYTDAQTAAALNAPRRAANPVPQGNIPKPFIAKADVQKALTGIILAMMKQTPPSPLLPAYQYFQSQVNAYAGDSYTAAEAAPYVAEFSADGTLTPAQIAALTTDPDPSWPATVALAPRAIELLGEVVAVEASDVTAAKAPPAEAPAQEPPAQEPPAQEPPAQAA